VGLVGGAAVLTWCSGYVVYRLGQVGMIGVEGSTEAALGLQPTVEVIALRGGSAPAVPKPMVATASAVTGSG
jgi:hypothetical protein